MSDKDFERKIAETFLSGVEGDPLLGLKDIKNYTEPNFIGRDNGELYLVRCYQCPDSEERGRENYKPNARHGCAWCEWKPDRQILDYIKAIRILKVLPPKRGMTLAEIRDYYPEQYDEALRAHKAGRDYTPDDQEDDGEID